MSSSHAYTSNKEEGELRTQVFFLIAVPIFRTEKEKSLHPTRADGQRILQLRKLPSGCKLFPIQSKKWGVSIKENTLYD